MTDAFGLFFDQAAEILRDPRSDSTSVLLALRVCCLTYRQDDVSLLLKADIFRLLHTLVTGLSVQAPKSLPGIKLKITINKEMNLINYV